MKNQLLPIFVLAAGFTALGAQAQVAAPATPAPAIETLGVPQTSVPQASQVVYAPRLPAAAELTNVAAAQGLTIEKIVQTSSQMTVVYRAANGQTNTVAYMLLPAGGAPVTTVTTTAPAKRVVYVDSDPEPVYYYDPFYYPPYYASPWYGPVSVSLGWGFGYHGGYHRGHYNGGSRRGGHRRW